jgi:hypothetical protein
MRSFLDEYEEQIAPVLREIDIFVKSSVFPVAVAQTSRVLGISNDEVCVICKGREIDKSVFFQIARDGSSDVCKLFRREVDLGSPVLYKPSDLAYIYGLDVCLVERAYQDSSLVEATTESLPMIFTKIPSKNA